MTGGSPLAVGDVFDTPGRTIGEGDIHLFAGLVGDFTPIHVDEHYARQSVHGGRIAHGPHGLAAAIGLFTQTGTMGERVVGLLNLNWDFSAPVFLGDTIRARVTVEELRATSKPGRHVGTFLFEVVNQNETPVQRGRMKVLLQGL